MAASGDSEEQPTSSSPPTGSDPDSSLYAIECVDQLKSMDKYNADISNSLIDLIDRVKGQSDVDADAQTREALVTLLLELVELEISNENTTHQRMRDMVDEMSKRFEDYVSKGGNCSDGKRPPYQRLQSYYDIQLRRTKRKHNNSSG